MKSVWLHLKVSCRFYCCGPNCHSKLFQSQLSKASSEREEEHPGQGPRSRFHCLISLLWFVLFWQSAFKQLNFKLACSVFVPLPVSFLMTWLRPRTEWTEFNLWCRQFWSNSSQRWFYGTVVQKKSLDIPLEYHVHNWGLHNSSTYSSVSSAKLEMLIVSTLLLTLWILLLFKYQMSVKADDSKCSYVYFLFYLSNILLFVTTICPLFVCLPVHEYSACCKHISW